MKVTQTALVSLAILVSSLAGCDANIIVGGLERVDASPPGVRADAAIAPCDATSGNDAEVRGSFSDGSDDEATGDDAAGGGEDAGCEGGGAPSCPPATPTHCSRCVDLTSDPSHCGGCGVACATSVINAQPTCVSGACSFSCRSGYTFCNGWCVDESTDDKNCGGCGVECMNGETCQGGSCEGDAGNETSDSAADSASSSGPDDSGTDDSGTDDSGTGDGACVATRCPTCIPVYQSSCCKTDGECGCMVVLSMPGLCE